MMANHPADFIVCDSCGTKFPYGYTFCPACGRAMTYVNISKPVRMKKPVYKQWWFWAICIVLIIGIIGTSGGTNNDDGSPSRNISDTTEAGQASTPKPTPEPTKSPDEIKADYIASCETVPYNDIARDPDQYKGTPVVFTGKVIQVSEGWFDSVTYRIATSGSYDDVIYVTYTRKEGESRILEDDRITLYGDCDGVTSYMSVLGGNITIPSVKMKYFEINE